MIKLISIRAIKHKNGDPRKDIPIPINIEIEDSELLEFEKEISEMYRPIIIKELGNKYDMHYLHQQR